jgi:CheY-like chemotaxis protein
MSKLKSICIIDDDRVYQLVMAKSIQRIDKSVQVKSFLSSHEALDDFSQALKAGEPLPEVVLLDINMPDLNGWQFLEALLALGPQPAPGVYIVSSSIAPADRERANSYGMVRQFLVKPIGKDTLAHIVAGAA